MKRRPGKGAVGRRLEASAARLGISATADDRREDLLLDIADDGSVSFRGRSGALELFHPETSLAALALLAARPVAGALDAEVVSVDEDVVELIARPPRRLLSEIASKRLVSAFGIAPPRERLSTSATEATRFETELGPGVVLKLVRPALENKTALGAIEPGVNGATAVRRAYHRLLRVGESLGPPAPLGVLVAEEISGGAHVWLERAKSETFGLVVLGGAGDRPTSAPGFALAAPATGAEAERALLRVELEATVSQREALAAAISRFSTLVAALGDRIHRAEIHSLVARAEGPALAVDALIGVSD